MPEVGIGTPVVVDPNPRFDHPGFGIVVEVFPRAVAIYMFSPQDIRAYSDCVHIADPNLERRESAIREAPHMAVWDLAPGEKERREAMKIIRAVQEDNLGMKRLHADLAGQLSTLQQKVTELRNAVSTPKRGPGRPPKHPRT
jgi:hypothetical protein